MIYKHYSKKGRTKNMQKTKKIAVNLFIIVLFSVMGIFNLANAEEIPLPTQVNTILDTAVSWLTLIAGSLALIFLILGGINFMTAGGDEAKIKKARDMITWAFVGIIIIALAQVFKSVANDIGRSLGGSGI